MKVGAKIREKKNNEVRPTIAPAYCLETISRQQHKECSRLLKMRKESKGDTKLEFPGQKNKQY